MTPLDIDTTDLVIHDEPLGNTVIPMAKGKTKQSSGQIWKWFFTLKASDPFDPNEPELVWNTLHEECKQFYYQLERGKGGFTHYQGCFSLKTKHRLSEVKNLLGFPTIHLENCLDWNAAKAYCWKSETRILGPWNHDSRWLKLITVLRPWQRLVIENILPMTDDDRTIWWLYDPVGNAGKTVFAKWLYVHHNAILLMNGRFCDIARAVSLDPKLIVFNFTRSADGHINYSAIESVKDGMLFNSKYKSEMRLFNSPIVICFSNRLPDMDAMSLDRWCIIDITK